MNNPIQAPTKGAPLKSAWGVAVTNGLNALQPFGAEGTLLSTVGGVGATPTPKNLRDRRGGGGGGASVKIFTVSGGNAESGYTGTVDGEETTETPRLFVPEIALGAELPVGSRVLGHEINLPITGGND